MLQTIPGYFQGEKFVPLQQTKIPDYVEVYVVVTNKPVEAKPLATEFPLFECAKGKGGWIADDFDAPLEEMEEYM